MSKFPHVDKALGYANGVISGEILAGKYVRLACDRHIRDTGDAESDAFPYRFDYAKAERICRFIELLPHTKGKWAMKRQLIVLQPWQCFILCVLFGWLHKETGLRRFRKAYLEIPRKNGKSIIAAGVGLYMLAADGEFGAEVYSGATTEKQAWEVFRPAKNMAERTPEYLEAYGVAVNASNINIADNGSRFEPIIGKPGDGASPSCYIADEYHEHPDDTQVDTMETGMGAREQPLSLKITTAGSDIAGPCYAARRDATQMLERTVGNDELFSCIWSIDVEKKDSAGNIVEKGDDWTSEAALRKANPNYDVSVSGEWLKAQQREAINSSRKQNKFKTKHLNLWVTARAAWMNMVDWNNCADPTLRPEQFKGEACYGALDLASKLDIASYARVFRRDVDGLPHFYAFARNYLPTARAEDPERQNYQEWVHEGHLIATEGDMIDFNRIEKDVKSDHDALKIAELGFDPYNATQLTTNLGEYGIACIEVPQNVRHLSEPMKMLEAYVKSGQFHHDGNPVLAWAMSNITVKPDRNDNIYPGKERSESKIDPAVAVIIAMSRALSGEPVGSIYETRGPRVFG